MSADDTERLKWAAHEAECEAAAVAAIAERKRSRLKTSPLFSAHDKPRVVGYIPDNAQHVVKIAQHQYQKLAVIDDAAEVRKKHAGYYVAAWVWVDEIYLGKKI